MKSYLRALIFAGLVMLPGCAALFDPATYAFLREPLWTTPASTAVAASNEDRSRDTDRPASQSRDRVDDSPPTSSSAPAPQSTDDDGVAADSGDAASSSSSSSSSDGPTPSGDSIPSNSDDDVPSIPSLPAGTGSGLLGGGIDPVGIDPGGQFGGLQLR